MNHAKLILLGRLSVPALACTFPALPALPAVASDDECSLLLGISQSKDGFADFRGDRQSATSWTTIALAPQFNCCLLEDQQSDAVYSCRTELEEAQRPLHLISSVMQLARRCLAQDWTYQLARRTGYESGVFSNGWPVEFEVGLRRERQVNKDTK